MGLQKGNTNNPNGRPKGSSNKITLKLRNNISDFLMDNWGKIQKDFDNLQPKERLQFFEKLLPYTIAKQKEVEVETEGREDPEIEDWLRRILIDIKTGKKIN